MFPCSTRIHVSTSPRSLSLHILLARDISMLRIKFVPKTLRMTCRTSHDGISHGDALNAEYGMIFPTSTTALVKDGWSWLNCKTAGVPAKNASQQTGGCQDEESSPKERVIIRQVAGRIWEHREEYFVIPRVVGWILSWRNQLR